MAANWTTRPASLRESLGATATYRILIFPGGRVPRIVTQALAEIRPFAASACRVHDRFDATAALWRSTAGDRVLLVGPAALLDDGVEAAREHGIRNLDIVLVPTDLPVEARGELADKRCAECHNAGHVPGGVVRCLGCALAGGYAA